MLERLNQDALDEYLRGAHGELMRRAAVQEVRRRAAEAEAERARTAQEAVDTLDALNCLELAGIRMSERYPCEEWAGWVDFLLEVLQERADADAYADFLRALAGDIETRLTGGRW